MAHSTNDRSLKALFDLGQDESEPHAWSVDTSGPGPLPNLDERVELFLRAVHGPNRTFTNQERAAARARILDAILADPPEEIREPSSIAAAQLASPPLPPAQAAARVPTRSLGEFIRDALLFPFVGGPLRFATASIAALFVIAGGWSATWFYAARSAETAVVAWATSEAGAGRVYECGSTSIGGFPFRLELSCTDPKVTITDDRSRTVVAAKDLRAVASVLQPGNLDAELTGPLSISDPGRSAEFLGNWARARMSTHGIARPEELSVSLSDLQFYRVAQNSMEPVLTSDRLEVTSRRESEPASGKPRFAFMARVAEATLSDAGAILSQPFSAEATAAIDGSAATTAATLSAQLKAWQAGSGRLEIKTARLQQGDAAATAGGSIGLTSAGRVDGTLKVAATGAYSQLAQTFMSNGGDRAAERDKVAQSIFEGARIRSRSLGNASVDSRPDRPSSSGTLPAPVIGTLDVPIRITDGIVYLGDSRIGELPPLF